MSFKAGTNNTGVLNRTIAKQRKEYQKLLTKYNALQRQVQDASQETTPIADKDTIIQAFMQRSPRVPPVLQDFLSDTFDNIPREPRGKRYPKLKKFAALTSFFGKYTCNILESALLMPSYQTAIMYRNKLLSRVGIDDNIYDGSADNMRMLIELNECQSGVKAVLMIDAVYVDPYVYVDSDGNVSGMLQYELDSVDDPKQMLEDEHLFELFLEHNANQVIESLFVFMLKPIDGIHKAFPIYCMPDSNGSAKPSIHGIINDIFTQLSEFKIEMLGIGTDGDPQYLVYSRVLVEAILADFKSFCIGDLIELIQSFDSLLHFSDPYHLSKRDRYKKIHNRLFCTSPVPKQHIRTVDALHNVGIPSYVLDDDLSRKMEDSLPMKMFAPEILANIVDSEDIHLLIGMLPTALLLDAIHSKYLTRISRIEELLFGASIVMIYYLVQKEFLENEDLLPKNEHASYKAFSCFSEEWCLEYLSLTLSASAYIATEKNVDLGAFGSHPIEHLFGNTKRMCHGNTTYQNFMSALKNVVSERTLSDMCGIKLPSVEGRHDSGVVLDDDPIEAVILFEPYLIQAKRLMNNFEDIPKVDLLDGLCDDNDRMSLDECRELIPQLFGKNTQFISTKKLKVTATGGLVNIRKWKASQQIRKSIE